MIRHYRETEKGDLMIMKYNFDKIPNRRGTNSLKWDVDRKELPMWVADMDFETVPEVQEALVQRVAHGVYGYSVIPDEWADSYVNWWEKRHHFRQKSHKRLSYNGVALLPPIRPRDDRISIYPVRHALYQCLLHFRHRLKIHIRHPHRELFAIHIPLEGICASAVWYFIRNYIS